MKKYCGQCGHELDNATGLCPNCSRKTAKYCAKCGSLLEPGSGLCSHCDKDITKKGQPTQQSNIIQDQNFISSKKSKRIKIIAIAFAAVLLLVIGIGGIWLYIDNQNRVKCTQATVIKVADAKGFPYPSFSIEIEGLNKTFKGDEKGINMNSLGLEEGKYTVVITEINGKETNISKDIVVTDDKENPSDNQDNPGNVPDELLIVTEEEMTDEERYQKVLDTFYFALNEKWSGEKILESEIEMPPASVLNYFTIDDVEYCFRDLDQNGINELILFSKDEKLFGVYLLENTNIKRLITVPNSAAMYICKNDLIEYSSMGGVYCNNLDRYVGNGNIKWFKLSNNKLEMIEGEAFESRAPGSEKYWRLSFTESESEIMAEETSKDYFDKYEHDHLDGKPLSELKR